MLYLGYRGRHRAALPLPWERSSCAIPGRSGSGSRAVGHGDWAFLTCGVFLARALGILGYWAGRLLGMGSGENASLSLG